MDNLIDRIRSYVKGAREDYGDEYKYPVVHKLDEDVKGLRKKAGLYVDYENMSPEDVAMSYGMALGTGPMGAKGGLAGALPRHFYTKPIVKILGETSTLKANPDLANIPVSYAQGKAGYTPGANLVPGKGKWFIRDRAFPARESINVEPGQDPKTALYDGLLAAMRQRGLIGK